MRRHHQGLIWDSPVSPCACFASTHNGYMVQLIGVTEKAAITKGHEEILAKLCNIKDVWCLPKEKGQ
jgi:hypothetical protein